MKKRFQKKGFYKHIDSNRKTKENRGLLLYGAGKLAANEALKAEALSAFFVSVFTSKDGL